MRVNKVNLIVSCLELLQYARLIPIVLVKHVKDICCQNR